MDKEQKERLEQELRFLKESLEADIISKEEYIKGKERIEKKLEELEEKKEEEITIKEIKEEKKPGIEESFSEEKVEKEGIKEEEIAVEEKEEAEEEKFKEQPPIEEETISGEKEPEKEGTKEEEDWFAEEEKKEPEAEKEKKPRKWWKWLRFFIIILLIYFLFKGCTEDSTPEITDDTETIEIKPECISDKDCQEAGKIGFCINPDTAEARCEFKEAVKINLTIVNDKDCEDCDAGRMTQIIKQLFPGVNEKEVHYNSAEGLRLLKTLDIEALPSYIFDSNIAEAMNFDGFKRALIKKEGSYLIMPVASGANYYFKREEIKNKLDLFVIKDSNTSVMAEKNVEDVLELFNNKIDYTKHIISETEKETLSQELGITSFPVFLVNNQLKFGGVRSPEAIKQKFCVLNGLEECETKLLEDIK